MGTHLLPHGKCPSNTLDPTSAEDPSSPLDTSCLPATANKPPEPPLLWEPSTLIPSSPSDQMPTSPTQTSPSSPLPKKNTQVVWPLKSPDGYWPTSAFTNSPTNS